MTGSSGNPGAPTGKDKPTPVPSDAASERDTAMHAAREAYRQHFETVVVGSEDDELRDAAFRLRYQVYCIENPFEDPTDNPNGREQDAYDERAVHCLLLHLPSHTWAGAVRLILPDQAAPQRSFTLQQVCFDPMIADPERFPVLEMAEVSRFCISKDFRKRRGDWLFPQSNEPESGQDRRRIIPNMTLGLIEGLVRMSLDRGIWHWCAVMEPGLLRLLARLGIHFENIGSLVDYHGHRQPCLIKLDTMLTQVHAERPDVWDILTDGGDHWDHLELARAGRPE